MHIQRSRFAPRSSLLALTACALLGLVGQARAQVDQSVNTAVWKQKYNVLDAQINQQPPYTNWLSQDDDGDGVTNGAELAAGTNPFRKGPSDHHFWPPAVSSSNTTVTFTFPTVAGKLYQIEGKNNLTDASWYQTGLPSVVGDGTSKTLQAPTSAGNFFHLLVTDQSSAGDQVSDWAKMLLGYATGTPINSQTSFTHSTLASTLQGQNVVTLNATDGSTTQPATATTAATDLGTITVSRSGHLLLASITVPILKSGTAVEGTDYVTLPNTLTFPAGVNSIDIKITPLYNASRTTSATVVLAAGAPGTSNAVGNYTVGSPSSASVTIYPSGNPVGTGLIGSYYLNSSSTYTNPFNFGGVTATYSYTKASTTTGSAVVSYAGLGTPATAYAVGNVVNLQFTSGNMNVSPYNAVAGGSYTVTGVSGTSLTVSITGTSVPSTGTGNVVLGGFNAPAVRLDPTVDFVWTGTGPGLGLPTTNYTVRWTGQVLAQYSEPTYFTVKSDDGARLWVNGQLILDKWQSQSVTDQVSSPITLQAGVYYDIRLEYLQLTGNTEVHLNWYCNDQSEQVIPLGFLFPTTTGGTPRNGSGDPPAAPPAITSATNQVALLGAGSPFTMTLTGSNGGSFSATGLPSWLTLTNGVLSGTPTQAGTYQFTVVTTNAAGSGSAVVTVQVLAPAGVVTRDLWTSGVTGTTVASVPFTTAPTASDNTLSVLEDTTTYAANTGERLRGYFTAPATGNYYFWIAASNAAELWVSNNSEPCNKVRRCYVTAGSATARTWNTQTTQQSPWLALNAGQQYYFEVLGNTGPGGAGNNLSVAWFLDPTGTTTSPIANGSGTAAPNSAGVMAAGGVMPGYVLDLWNNPPTITTPGTVYITNLQGVSGLNNITGTGSSYLRVNGTTAVVHLNYSGLTSGVTSQGIYSLASGSPVLVFNIGAQAANYPTQTTSDGGYTWSMQASDLTSLNNGTTYLLISTVNNPSGELAGTYGVIAGSQVAPAVPSYPAWTDDSATVAGASRFLTQATFGPSPSDIAYVQANGYRAWIENQFSIAATHNVPYVLANLTNDPQNPYTDTLFFNSWWKNAVTAPDQLRQRTAFALSEIMVASDVGTLNNNGRTLADYYDNLLDYGFGTYHDLLKQVTLTSAMGLYLDMLENGKGNMQTGLHPNENYAREIMQLFSIGLYRLWPDGTLVLDSTGNPVATYNQATITGLARVFTGWSWGQPLVSGRLPTSMYPASNYLDPMVLASTYHELGTKILLDNVMLPAATVTTQSSTATNPSSTYTIQSTDPVLGQGNLVTTTITNLFDLNGVVDLENTLNNLVNNAAIGPYVCRQLIQRMVTSNPKPAYVNRVVRAFNGEQNVDGAATGVRGDMKEVVRAILLDYEARSPTAAADNGYGKQREPLMRITGPARTFPAAGYSGSTYRQIGGQIILVTTPSAHRLVNSDTVLLDTFVDSGNSTTNLPSTGGYSVSNVTPSYSLVTSTLAYSSSGSTVTITATGFVAGNQVYVKFSTGGLLGAGLDGLYTIATVTGTNFTINLASSPASTSGNCMIPTTTLTITNSSSSSKPVYQLGDTVAIQFTGTTTLGVTAPYNTVQNYTVTGATATTFTINLGNTTLGTTSGTAFTPNNFTVNNSTTTLLNYNSVGSAVTLNGGGYIAGHQLYITFSLGGLAGGTYDGVYTITSATGTNFVVTLTSSPANTSGDALIPKYTGGYNITNNGSTSTISLQTNGNHNLKVGDSVWIDFLVGNSPTAAPSQVYTVASVPGTNLFTVTTTPAVTAGSQSTSGDAIYPLSVSTWTRSGTVTVDMGTWNIGNSSLNTNDLLQSPMYSTTVFNFFYPNYQYPGAMAKAGMTTPEFQLTNDSNTMSLTNAVTLSVLQAGNSNGFTSYRSGGGAVQMDLSKYMTYAQTQDSAVPALTSTLGTLLTGGNLSSATQTAINTYVASQSNFPLASGTYTNAQMSNRVRAIVHLILTSAEYAIQK